MKRVTVIARWMAFLLFVPTLLFCGGDDESLGVSNVSPQGSVGGIVVDASTMKAMEGVQVSVIAGGKIYPDKPAATDATGFFSVSGLPAGSLIVQVTPKSLDNHHAITFAADLPSAAGEFPLANATLSLGPIGLIPLANKSTNTAFKVQVVTSEGTAPTAGVKAFLHAPVGWVDLKAGTVQPRGSVVVEAAANASGLLTFLGMPDYSKLAGLVGSGGISDVVRVRIPPLDMDQDGRFDFLGMEESFAVNKLKGSIPTIVLSSPNKQNKLLIEAASVAALAGKTGNRLITGTAVSGTIFAAFNHPILPNETEIILYNELGVPLVSAPEKNINGNLLSITVKGLKEGAEYNLHLRTFAKVEGTMLEGNFGAPFFTPTQKPVTAALSRDTGTVNRILVTFSEPVGTGFADKHLSGANSVVFFDYDINGTGVIGDAPAERKASSSNVALNIAEVEPPGPAGKSGIATTWYFDLPLDILNNPIPANTPLDLALSRSSLAVQRGSGKLVPDIKNLSVPY